MDNQLSRMFDRGFSEKARADEDGRRVWKRVAEIVIPATFKGSRDLGLFRGNAENDGKRHGEV